MHHVPPYTIRNIFYENREIRYLTPTGIAEDENDLVVFDCEKKVWKKNS